MRPRREGATGPCTAMVPADSAPNRATVDTAGEKREKGEKVARFLATTDVHTRCYGIPRNFYDRFDPQELLASCGITVAGIANDTLKLLRV